MKTFIFSALAMAVMASCTNSSIDEVVNNDEPVAIRLGAGVQTNVVAGTRAPIASGTFNATVLGWENNTPDYATTPKWKTTTSAINAIGSTPNITLTLSQYYLADGTKTFMKAFYAEDATVDETSGWIYNFTNTDGQKDLLMAPAVNGDKTISIPVNFAFVHPLMQLKFKLVAGKGFPSDVTVTSIKVKDAKLPIGVDMSTDKVLYSETSLLTVPGITNATMDDPEGAGKPIMIEPFATNKFSLEIVTSNSKTYEPEVTLDNFTTGAGVAYTVTLTFQEKMTATATVSDWTPGTGSGTVE